MTERSPTTTNKKKDIIKRGKKAGKVQRSREEPPWVWPKADNKRVKVSFPSDKALGNVPSQKTPPQKLKGGLQWERKAFLKKPPTGRCHMLNLAFADQKAPQKKNPSQKGERASRKRGAFVEKWMTCAPIRDETFYFESSKNSAQQQRATKEGRGRRGSK